MWYNKKQQVLSRLWLLLFITFIRVYTFMQLSKPSSTFFVSHQHNGLYSRIRRERCKPNGTAVAWPSRPYIPRRHQPAPSSLRRWASCDLTMDTRTLLHSRQRESSWGGSQRATTSQCKENFLYKARGCRASEAAYFLEERNRYWSFPGTHHPFLYLIDSDL